MMLLGPAVNMIRVRGWNGLMGFCCDILNGKNICKILKEFFFMSEDFGYLLT